MGFAFNYQNRFVTKTLCVHKKNTKKHPLLHAKYWFITVTQIYIDTDHMCTKQKTYGFSEDFHGAVSFFGSTHSRKF